MRSSSKLGGFEDQFSANVVGLDHPLREGGVLGADRVSRRRSRKFITFGSG
jgi:hypothetical protein